VYRLLMPMLALEAKSGIGVGPRCLSGFPLTQFAYTSSRYFASPVLSSSSSSRTAK
jgi:hypothetical protein